MHIRNAADRAIMEWRNHFVSGISDTDNLFTIHLWYRLLDQVHITLNMLRNSKHDPKISAHVIMEGNFDFNKNPLVPPGTKVIVN